MKQEGSLCDSQSISVQTLFQELIYEGIDTSIIDCLKQKYYQNPLKKSANNKQIKQILGIHRAKSFYKDSIKEDTMIDGFILVNEDPMSLEDQDCTCLKSFKTSDSGQGKICLKQCKSFILAKKPTIKEKLEKHDNSNELKLINLVKK